MKRLFLLAFAVATALGAARGSAADSNLFVDKNPNIYLFYMNDCPYSKKARAFLTKEAKKDEKLHVTELNVTTSEAFQDLLQRVYERIGLAGFSVVPLIVVGNHFQIGYDGDDAGKEILSDLADCRANGCTDWVGEMMNDLNQMASPVVFHGRIASLSTKITGHGKPDTALTQASPAK